MHKAGLKQGIDLRVRSQKAGIKFLIKYIKNRIGKITDFGKRAAHPHPVFFLGEQPPPPLPGGGFYIVLQ